MRYWLTPQCGLISDWFHPSIIHLVTHLPGQIQFIATDNVLVSSVLVTITDGQGTLLEQGEAVKTNDFLWEHNTTTKGSVSAQARDLAGNVTIHNASTAA